MPAEIVRLDLRMRRRSLIGYSLGMAVYAFVIVALYPTFKDDASLNQLTENSPTVAALFGASGSLTSPSGWLNANLYANFVPLIVLLMTIGYGASCIAGQNEDGHLGMITTLPVSRRSIATQKLTAMSLQALPVAIVTALSIAAGGAFDLHFGIDNLAGITAGVALLSIDFGALALFVGAVTGSRGAAIGISSAVAAASYLISSLAPVVGWLRPARFGSPFFYGVGDGQLEHGLSAGDAAALVTMALVLSFAAFAAFERLDVR